MGAGAVGAAFGSGLEWVGSRAELGQGNLGQGNGKGTEEAQGVRVRVRRPWRVGIFSGCGPSRAPPGLRPGWVVGGASFLRMNLFATVANSLWAAGNVPGWLRFRRALGEPGNTQRGILRRLVRENAETVFGRARGLGRIGSYEEFARRVPVVEYAGLAPWIERIRGGEQGVLTRERVTHLIPTSGTTSGRKLIPFTAGLQREFQAGIGPWLVELQRRAPGVLGGPAYWSVTPVFQAAEVERSAVPVGFDSDAAYLGGARRRLVEAVMAVPAGVLGAPTGEAFRYATMLALLRCRELRLISVWHPSFLTLLLDALPGEWERLVADVEHGGCAVAGDFPAAVRGNLDGGPQPGRARELRAGGGAGGEVVRWWPELRVISCWGGGAAAGGVAELRGRFPEVWVQEKGLLATEAMVSLPFGEQQVLAVGGHFFEFLDDDGRVWPAEALRSGPEYEVVVTTGGGLWRYRLGDRVAVSGRVGRTPALRFLGRSGGVSDRCGEKLTEAFVLAVLREVWAEAGRWPRFVLLAPDEAGGVLRYTLYVEGAELAGVAAALERGLRKNPQYALCRELGQLQAARVFAVAGRGYEVFAAQECGRGGRLGAVKPAVLSGRGGWTGMFAGRY